MACKITRLVLHLVVALVFAAIPVRAGYAPNTTDEYKCEKAMSKGLGKFWDAKVKCVTKCWQAYRKALVPASDCMAPYGGATLTCIVDPVKGVEAKASSKITKVCLGAACPICYSGGDCITESVSRVFATENIVDIYAPLFWCDDSGSFDGFTAAEAKCQDDTAKAIAKLWRAKSKCYDKCVANDLNGKIPAGSCLPPAPADTATTACLSLAETKAEDAIDKVCYDLGEDPECFPGMALLSGAHWVNFVAGPIDLADLETYCPVTTTTTSTTTTTTL